MGSWGRGKEVIPPKISGRIYPLFLWSNYFSVKKAIFSKKFQFFLYGDLKKTAEIFWFPHNFDCYLCMSVSQIDHIKRLPLYFNNSNTKNLIHLFLFYSLEKLAQWRQVVLKLKNEVQKMQNYRTPLSWPMNPGHKKNCWDPKCFFFGYRPEGS